MRRVAKFARGRPLVGYALVAVLTAGVVGGGWALAAGSGTLHACAKKRGGALRLATHCRSSERAVSWSAQGPAGSAGANGGPGPAGTNGAPGAPGVQYAWQGWIQPAGGNAHPAADHHVATFTFTSPAAGFADVTAHFGVRMKEATNTDCHVQSQLAAAPAVPAAGAGYMDTWINGNLPTELGGGTYLQLDASVTRVFPVIAGSNVVYLNGTHDCADALWGPVSISAIFANENPAATLTAP